MSTNIAPVFSAKDLNELNYVDMAQKVIEQHFKEEKGNTISTNQIRNFLEWFNILREQLRIKRVDTLNEDMISQVQYIKLRLVYAAGRNTNNSETNGVFEFMQRSGLIACLETIGDSSRQFLLICKYMEALIAYHKWFETEALLMKDNRNQNYSRNPNNNSYYNRDKKQNKGGY